MRDNWTTAQFEFLGPCYLFGNLKEAKINPARIEQRDMETVGPPDVVPVLE